MHEDCVKLTEGPDGDTETERDTGCAAPVSFVTVIVLVMLCPCCTFKLPLLLISKSNGATLFTLTVIDALPTLPAAS